MTPRCDAHRGVDFFDFVIEYLGEIETEFKKTSACLSGAYMGSNHKKTGGQKSRDTLPLRDHKELPPKSSPFIHLCSYIKPEVGDFLCFKLLYKQQNFSKGIIIHTVANQSPKYCK